MDNIFTQLAIILGLCSSLGFVVYKLKLPLLIAYLVSGLILAVFKTFDLNNSYVFSFLPDIGIAFVLFLVGMELDLREFKNFGKQILSAGVLQTVITCVIGAFIAQSFGFGLVPSIYLGIGLSFSSTIVVVKMLIDRKELGSLYGRLSVGVLLLEDFIAVIVLLLLTSTNTLSFTFESITPVAFFLGKVIALFIIAWVLHKFFLSVLFKSVSDSGELLLLTALAWCFLYITIATLMGFSVLIGAFLAGVALASSAYHFQIQGKIKPMRDFFVALFFVYLGTQVNFPDILQNYQLISIFILYSVVIKPIIFMLIFGIFGFKKHTMFHTAINMSQISEFSLIIILIGLKQGLLTQSALSVIAVCSIVSIIISSLLISRSGSLYKIISSILVFFEREGEKFSLERSKPTELEGHVVVIGSHRVGGELVRFFKKEGISQLVLDFNPIQVEALLGQGIPVIYGDMADPEILDILNLNKSKMIISTSPDLNDNRVLLEDLKNRHIYVPVIVRAETIKQAENLYKAGADFVIIPEVLAGEALMEMVKEHIGDNDFFRERARIEMSRLSKKVLAQDN